MRDVRQRLGEERDELRERGIALDRALPRHRADPHAVRAGADAGERRDAVQIDEHRRARQPEVHRGDEALPAGEGLGVAAVLSE